MWVVEARYQGRRRTYAFESEEKAPRSGDPVVVETDRGPVVARICAEPVEAESAGNLPKALRAAEADDVSKQKQADERSAEAFRYAGEAITRRRLPMRLITVDSSYDGAKMTFSFTADARVDFRELVRELAGRYRARIEMLQIGVRDAARVLTGVGVCGREFCCATYLNDFAPVSIKMAKDQCMALNDSKVSGVCGRLKCCLRYEHDLYAAFSKGLPKVGKRCLTPDGEGRVTRHDPLQGKVLVNLGDGREIGFEPDQVQRKEVAPDAGAAPPPENAARPEPRPRPEPPQRPADRGTDRGAPASVGPDDSPAGDSVVGSAAEESDIVDPEIGADSTVDADSGDE